MGGKNYCLLCRKRVGVKVGYGKKAEDYAYVARKVFEGMSVGKQVMTDMYFCNDCFLFIHKALEFKRHNERIKKEKEDVK